MLAQTDRHSGGQALCCCIKCWHIVATADLRWEIETLWCRGKQVWCNSLHEHVRKYPKLKQHAVQTDEKQARQQTLQPRRNRAGIWRFVRWHSLWMPLKLLIMLVITGLQLQLMRDTWSWQATAEKCFMFEPVETKIEMCSCFSCNFSLTLLFRWISA